MSLNKSIRMNRTVGLSMPVMYKSKEASNARDGKLNDHIRNTLEYVIDFMRDHDRSMAHLAKLEFLELMEMEQKLKEKNPKKFQECSAIQRKTDDVRDPVWGASNFDLIHKSRSTKLDKKLRNDALRELNSLQRSARAFLAESEKEIANAKLHSRSAFPKVSKGVGKFPSTTSKQGDNFNSSRNQQRKKDSLSNSLNRSTENKSLTRSTENKSLTRSTESKYTRQDSGTVTISQQEYDKLKRTITLQNAEIDDLTTRLSRMASKQLTEGNPNITDLSDKNRPIKIGERFGELYDNEWTEAHEILRQMQNSEEESIYILLKIVRYAYAFCKNMAEKQLQELQVSMEMHVLNVNYSAKSLPSTTVQRSSQSIQHGPTKKQGPTYKFAKDYRKATAAASVPNLIQIFKEETLKTELKLNHKTLPGELLQYIDVCVELTWLMNVQDPPMVFTWAVNGDRLNQDYYKPYLKLGSTVKYTVWPALFLHAKGPLMAKGFAFPK